MSRFEKDGVGGPSSQSSSGSADFDDGSRRPDKLGSKKKAAEKKKSNLEIFKEELKM